MKKLFLFTCLSALALTFNSCSDDDNKSNETDGTSGTVTFKVNGVAKTYNTITVNPESEVSDGETFEWITITASPEGSASEFVTFELEKEAVGADASNYFEYVENNVTYYWDNEFNVNTLTNNNDKVKGTFSGTVSIYDANAQETVTKTISEGTFDINR
ncbi:hypothetical protein FMM05_04860 [Flavobacterium zepuense]|uniref:Lipoprotein n=1 Tax=Flavobacterium zepuense TaxID=2593302 RepID=A0A552V8D1_9FLAO|nr:hypothetical protein [Flavobacterium zepuense]TRW26710.1 hypothetical protein FMM05_04860 [Flavobacterium zepuense]